MRSRQAIGWLLLFVCTTASAERVRTLSSLRPQTTSAAAVRAVAPFGLVTSTFRTVAHNRAVGGVPDSYHLLGRAIDVVRKPGISHARIAAALTAAGFHLIESLDEGSHSHFAFASTPFASAAAVRAFKPAPKQSLIAADEHGTLRSDLLPQAVASKRRDTRAELSMAVTRSSGR